MPDHSDPNAVPMEAPQPASRKPRTRKPATKSKKRSRAGVKPPSDVSRQQLHLGKIFELTCASLPDHDLSGIGKDFGLDLSGEAPICLKDANGQYKPCRIDQPIQFAPARSIDRLTWTPFGVSFDRASFGRGKGT